MPTLVQLEGDGPFETPAVEGFLGLTSPGGRLPIQIRLVLKGGSELHLPIAKHSLEKLAGQFAAIHAELQKQKKI